MQVLLHLPANIAYPAFESGFFQQKYCRSIPDSRCNCGNSLDMAGTCNDCLVDDDGLTSDYLEGVYDGSG